MSLGERVGIVARGALDPASTGAPVERAIGGGSACGEAVDARARRASSVLPKAKEPPSVVEGAPPQSFEPGCRARR